MKVGVNVGKPRVAYKETIVGKAEARGIHKKQTGGRGQFGDCTITIEPYTKAQAEEEELDFKDSFAFKTKSRVVRSPGNTSPASNTAAADRQERCVGRLPHAGHESYTDRRFLPRCGLVADRPSSRRGCSRSKKWTRKPAAIARTVMKVTVTTPDDYLGSVTGDLNRRRGMIVGTEERGNTRMVIAEAPLSEMFGYSTSLRGMSQGRATYVDGTDGLPPRARQYRQGDPRRHAGVA